MNWVVGAETDVCIGSGNCAFLCEEVFGQSVDGTVRLVRTSVPEEASGPVREAVIACPVGALCLTPEPAR